MIRLLITRLLQSAVTLLAVSLVVFLMMAAAPGNAAISSLGGEASAEEIRAAEARLGLDRPVLERYWTWLSDTAKGDFGTSVVSGQEVGASLLEAFPITLSLALGAVFVAVIFGLTAGLLAAIKPGKIDRLVGVWCSVGLAVPGFWLSMMLLNLLAVRAGWFPTFGYRPLSDGFLTWVRHLILPALALGFVGAAEVARHSRGSMQSALEADYLRTSTAAGLRRSQLLVIAARNAMIPILTVIGLQVTIVLSGSVVIESIFNLPGMGSLIVTSVLKRDFTMIQGVVMVTTCIAIVVNLVVDMCYGLIDPRLRVSGSDD